MSCVLEVIISCFVALSLVFFFVVKKSFLILPIYVIVWLNLSVIFEFILESTCIEMGIGRV